MEEEMAREPKSRSRRRGLGKNDPFARRNRTIRQRLGALSSDALIVDIGSGVLRRTGLASRQRYFATDIRPLPNVDFVSNAMALPLGKASVDAMLVLEVLEHVPQPRDLLQEVQRVLKPGGTVIVSVPSAVPRHDDHDYWRYTAEGLNQLCSELFRHGEIHIFGGTFEALGYLLGYYLALGAHRLRIPARRVRVVLISIGYWLDRHNKWSSSTHGLHTLAFDLVFIGKAPFE